MKKILLLFALLPFVAFGQRSTSFSKSGTGNLSKSDTSALLATQYDLATSVGIDYPGAGIPLSTGTAWGTPITNNSTNWNTAYTDRLKWDGGSTGLVAATARTSLGATTVGKALFMIANPGAIAFLRINADSTVTALSAANFRTALSLDNLTNKAQIELEDSVNYANGYMSRYGGVTGLAGKVAKADSGVWAGGYITPKSLNTNLAGKAATTLGNLASVAINTTLLPATDDGAGLGNTSYKFSDIFLASGSVINLNSGDVTLTHSTNLLTIGGGGLSIGGGYDLTMTGSIGATGTRLTKIWTDALEITNSPTVNGTSIASIYAPLASPAFTGTPKISTDTVATKAYARSVGGLAIGAVQLADSGVWADGYVTPADLDAAIAPLNDTVELGTIAPLNTDTIPFATFGLGSGQTVDTAQFNNNAFIGSFYNKGSDSLVITSLKCYIYTGTGTETVGVNIAWSDTIMAVNPVKLNTSAYTVTSHVVGSEDTSFNNGTIPPGKLVYGWISGVSAGNRPSYLTVTLSGYKQNRKY